MALNSDIQKPNIGEIVTLFQIDATGLGAAKKWYFTQTLSGGNTISFDGDEYTPIDIHAEGFELSNTGKLPRPSLAISNVDSIIASEIIEYGDLLGALVIRVRTLSKYLDGEPFADPTVKFPIDTYIINQKKLQNNKVIQFELITSIDLESLILPGRQILRDTCTHTYRYYTTGPDFVYTNVTCPYTGSNYFKANGDTTSEPAEDVCGKRLSDCELRYPLTSDELPTRAFPSVARGNL